MRRTLTRPRTILSLLLLAMVLASVPQLEARSGGIPADQASTGCNCHSTAAAGDVTVTLSGLPESSFNASQTYTLVIGFVGGPGSTANQNVGGFVLAATGGTFAPTDATTQVHPDGSIGHTTAGNDQQSWTVEWTAPADASIGVEFTYFANSVNGDASSNTDDHWAQGGIELGAVAAPTARSFVIFATALLMGVLLLLAVVGYAFILKHPYALRTDVFWPWLREWLTGTDHKVIGTLYFTAGLFFFVIGGLLAFMIRLQLVTPENDFLTKDEYNQFFTLHGTTMIFLAAMPLINGFGNYIIPLQLGAKDLAFPRINAMSFWLLVAGAIPIFYGVFSGTAADVGWTGYAPYSVSESSHSGTTLWVGGQILLVGSSTLTGINFLTTFVTMRAPGVTFMRMPLFSWSILVSIGMLFISIPAFGVGLIFLFLDRTLGTQFFDPAANGDPVLWQHLFWYFGHPEVYVVILPAFGVVSEVLSVSARRAIFGYRSMVYALGGIGLVSFLVWGHHMLTSGMNAFLRLFFMILTMLVAIPTGVKIFNWIATLNRGKIVWRTHLLFALAFLVTFTMGGISGMFFPVAGLDVAFHDTYFVVAHFHYVLIGGVVFGLFSGIYYWYPKMTGRLMNERMGLWHFLLSFVGFNATFWPMHQLGIDGMRRRTFTYGAEHGWADLNLFISMSALLFGLSQLLLIINLIRSLSHGSPAGANPWGGWSLEWTVPSPPPTPSFDEIPVLYDENEHHETGMLERFLANLGRGEPAPTEIEHPGLPPTEVGA